MEKAHLIRASGNKPARYVDLATYGQRKTDNPSFHASAAMGISVTEVVLGILALIFGLVGTIIISPAGLTGSGIWTGMTLIVTGVIGILAAVKRGDGLIVSYMILNILNAVVCTAAVVSTFYFVYDGAIKGSLYTDKELAMDVLVLILAFIGLALSVAASGFGCATVCCPPSAPKERQVIRVSTDHTHGERSGDTVAIVKDESSAVQYSERTIEAKSANEEAAEELQDSLMRKLDPEREEEDKPVVLVTDEQRPSSPS